MGTKTTVRRLTVCGEISVFEEKIVEHPEPEKGATDERSPGAAFPTSMVETVADVLYDYAACTQENFNHGNKNTINTIRAIRALTDCGLKEAKAAYERVA